MVGAGLSAAMILREPGGAGLLVLGALVWLLCLAHVLETRWRDREKARARLAPSVKWLKRVKAAVFVATFITTMVALEAAFTSTGSRTGPEPPPLFPVVVLTGSTAGDLAIRLVYYRDLETFSRTHPDTTYVVPAADVERLRATLIDGNFTVTPLANGRQAFKVWKQVHPEAHVTGWYEASAKEVCPSRFVLFHGMIRGVFFFPALVVSVVSMSIAGRLLQRAPKRRRGMVKSSVWP
jgi:hypothetical protein